MTVVPVGKSPSSGFSPFSTANSQASELSSSAIQPLRLVAVSNTIRPMTRQ